MLIKEVCKITNLTKKAIKYYEEKQLISPKILNNKYRYYDVNDIKILKKISTLRKLDIQINDIKKILSDNSLLKKVLLNKSIELKAKNKMQIIFNDVITENNWDKINLELDSIEKTKTIAEKILFSFPGYYGSFLMLHFSSFLDMTIENSKQEDAYTKIIEYLDNISTINFPKEIIEFLKEQSNYISIKDTQEIIDKSKYYTKNPSIFLDEHEEFINNYIDYKKSEDYKKSLYYKLKKLMGEFNKSKGYYEVFIPAMENLSPSYKNYRQQLNSFNKDFFVKYPSFEN